MAMTFHKKVVSTKIGMLEEQRNHLQNLVLEADKVLQQANSWLRNADDTNNVTFKDINKRIDDKFVLLSDRCTDFSDGFEEVTIQQEYTTSRSLPPVSTSTVQPFPARYDHFSVVPDELKDIMSQVKDMQASMFALNMSTEKISKKQLIVEQCIESLSVKYTKLEQDKIKALETKLTSISEKQKKLKDKRLKSLENKIQAVTDAQSETKENQQQLKKIMMKEQKMENVKLQKQFTQDLHFCLENIQELNSRICLLETQTYVDTQLEAFEKRVAFLETNSECLSEKFEEHVSSFEEFTKSNEETFKKLAFVQGTEFERLEKSDKKISDLEISWNDYLQETRTLYKDVETKYQMVGQSVDDRLIPLERLREIFNEKLDIREKNMKKLDSVCDKMADLLPKFSQLEKESRRQAIGFSARVILSPETNKVVTNFTTVFSNVGSHFNDTTGEFIAPLDGLYAACVSVETTANENVRLTAVRKPCIHKNNTLLCSKCVLFNICMDKGEKLATDFVVMEMKARDTLYMIGCYVKEGVYCGVGFTCFRIG